MLVGSQPLHTVALRQLSEWEHKQLKKAIAQRGVPINAHIAGCIAAWSLHRLMQGFVLLLPLLDPLIYLCSCPVCELHHFVACTVVEYALIGFLHLM